MIVNPWFAGSGTTARFAARVRRSESLLGSSVDPLLGTSLASGVPAARSGRAVTRSAFPRPARVR